MSLLIVLVCPRMPERKGRSNFPLLFPAGHLVNEVRGAVDNFRREMSERTTGMKEAFERGKGKLYHVITANNRIVQFR